MGYYIEHRVRVLEGDRGLIKKLRAFSEDVEGSVDDDGESLTSTKGHNIHEDMEAFSRLHPETLFELKRIPDDDYTRSVWYTYFKDGKSSDYKPDKNKKKDPFKIEVGAEYELIEEAKGMVTQIMANGNVLIDGRYLSPTDFFKLWKRK